MKRYWDSSALIDALHNPGVAQKALESEQFTRPHALAEMFFTLTGGRLEVQYHPDDAAKLIADLTAGFTFIELSAGEVKAALSQARKRGVRGGRVHDWLHAVAAKKSGARQLVTDNLSDFAGLEDGFSVAAP